MSFQIQIMRTAWAIRLLSPSGQLMMGFILAFNKSTAAYKPQHLTEELQ